MLCRDEASVIDKLCSLGEKFNELFEKRNMSGPCTRTTRHRLWQCSWRWTVT